MRDFQARWESRVYDFSTARLFHSPSRRHFFRALRRPFGRVAVPASAAPPVDANYGFASYHSKTVVIGNVVDYTRTFEVKELSVPVAKADELKKFYRIIASDERNTVVLKPSP